METGQHIASRQSIAVLLFAAKLQASGDRREAESVRPGDDVSRIHLGNAVTRL